jgi:hypothetical protein
MTGTKMSGKSKLKSPLWRVALHTAAMGLPMVWGRAWLVLILLWAVSVSSPLALGYFTAEPLVLALVVIVSIALGLSAYGGMYRLYIFGRYAKAEGLGFGGLQIGWPELRLIMAAFFSHLFLVIIAATVLVVGMIVFQAAGLGLKSDTSLGALFELLRPPFDESRYILWAGLVLFALLIVFLALKLSLFAAASYAQRRVVSLNVLGLSKGRTLDLLLGWLVIGSAAGALIWQAYSLHTMSDQRLIIWRLSLISGLGIFFILPLMVGFLSSAYLQMQSVKAHI